MVYSYRLPNKNAVFRLFCNSISCKRVECVQHFSLFSNDFSTTQKCDLLDLKPVQDLTFEVPNHFCRALPTHKNSLFIWPEKCWLQLPLWKVLRFLPCSFYRPPFWSSNIELRFSKGHSMVTLRETQVNELKLNYFLIFIV